jgi:hypothetical protein
MTGITARTDLMPELAAASEGLWPGFLAASSDRNIGTCQRLYVLPVR